MGVDRVTIMMLPDDTYVSARPFSREPHLSLAYFGQASTLPPAYLESLVLSVNTIARQTKPVQARVSGAGLFDFRNDGFVLVDLIDSIDLFSVRMMVERRYGGQGAGLRINHDGHGFIPHITRRFYNREDDFYFALDPEDVDGVRFTFNRIAVWADGFRHEVEL